MRGGGRPPAQAHQPPHCHRRRPSGLQEQPHRRGLRGPHHRRRRHRRQVPPQGRPPPLPPAQSQTAQRMRGLHSTPSAPYTWPGCAASRGSTAGPRRPPPSPLPPPLQRASALHSPGRGTPVGTVAVRLPPHASGHTSTSYKTDGDSRRRRSRRRLQPRRQDKSGTTPSAPPVGRSRRPPPRRQRWRPPLRSQPLIARGPSPGSIGGAALPPVVTASVAAATSPTAVTPPPYAHAPSVAATTPPTAGTLLVIATLSVSRPAPPPVLAVATHAPQATTVPQARRPAAPRAA